jgi:hypothetical protein
MDLKVYRRKAHLGGDGKLYINLPKELVKHFDLLPGDELILVRESKYEWLLHKGKRK